jgi:hypothetical protein
MVGTGTWQALALLVQYLDLYVSLVWNHRRSKSGDYPFIDAYRFFTCRPVSIYFVDDSVRTLLRCPQ